jgi:ribosome-binding protein aMBF1 (putative translation factor)
VEIRTVDDLLEVAKAMYPFCVKKANDLQIAIDYLEDKVTGDVAIERFNAEVKSGRRSGYIRQSSIPYTRSEGIRLWRLSNARRARAAYAVNVPEDVITKIKQDRNSDGMGYYRLAKKYGYSESVIRRILGRP